MTIKRYLDFKILREDSSEYKLRDGGLLKARYILTKVFIGDDRDEYGNPIYGTNFSNVVAVFVPDALRGAPSKEIYGPEQLSKSIVEEDMEFEKIKEGWNTYEMADGAKISVKLVLSMVSRTSKHDSMGEPIYIVNLQPITKGTRRREPRK